MEITATNQTNDVFPGASAPVQSPTPTRRRPTRLVNVGGIKIGGSSPISVQTMTKTKTGDVDATVAQIIRATEAGADIVRVTVNDKEAADAMKNCNKDASIEIFYSNEDELDANGEPIEDMESCYAYFVFTKGEY